MEKITKSVPGHFLFSSHPSKPTKSFSLYALATISMVLRLRVYFCEFALRTFYSPCFRMI